MEKEAIDAGGSMLWSIAMSGTALAEVLYLPLPLTLLFFPLFSASSSSPFPPAAPSLCKALYAWYSWRERQVYLWGVLERCAARIRNRLLSMAFDSWAAVWEQAAENQSRADEIRGRVVSSVSPPPPPPPPPLLHTFPSIPLLSASPWIPLFLSLDPSRFCISISPLLPPALTLPLSLYHLSPQHLTLIKQKDRPCCFNASVSPCEMPY